MSSAGLGNSTLIFSSVPSLSDLGWSVNVSRRAELQVCRSNTKAKRLHWESAWVIIKQEGRSARRQHWPREQASGSLRWRPDVMTELCGLGHVF